MTAVAIVGPGGVGSFFAAHLTAAGQPVLSCARRPFDEYVIDSPTHALRAPADVVTDPADLAGHDPADIVLVGLKAQQTAGAAGWFGPLTGPDTVVVAMQNGIEAADRLAPLTNGATVLQAVVYCGAELLEPGHVRHGAHERLILPPVAASDAVASLFADTPTDVAPSQDWLDEAWRKLGINVVLNGITALTMREIDVVADPALADTAGGLLAEVWRVGRAEGAGLGDDDVERFVAALPRLRAGGTSMLFDRLAGRATEHDAIHGAVLRAADRHGMDVPLTRALHGLLHAVSPTDAP